jgi:hypothetical protein
MVLASREWDMGVWKTTKRELKAVCVERGKERKLARGDEWTESGLD